MHISPYEYIAVMCFSLLGVLIAVVMIIDLMKKPQERKEEEMRKKLRDACVGKTKEE